MLVPVCDRKVNFEEWAFVYDKGSSIAPEKWLYALGTVDVYYGWKVGRRYLRDVAVRYREEVNVPYLNEVCAQYLAEVGVL